MGEGGWLGEGLGGDGGRDGFAELVDGDVKGAGGDGFEWESEIDGVRIVEVERLGQLPLDFGLAGGLLGGWRAVQSDGVDAGGAVGGELDVVLVPGDEGSV